MAETTSIEWTESSWNPIIAIWPDIVGADPDEIPDFKRGWHCVHASDGCRNCYAETLNKRLGTGLAYTAQNTRNVHIELAQGGQSGIDWPLRARKPRRIFVCSMTDLFGDWVPDEMIDRVFAVMALAHQHTFQVLTKRADRMREYLSGKNRQSDIEYDGCLLLDDGKGSPPDGAILDPGEEQIGSNPADILRIPSAWTWNMPWPLGNVWIGVSCEDQKTADDRIPYLLQTPAAVRWVSYEPAIGPVDFSSYLRCPECGYSDQDRGENADHWRCSRPFAALSWVIVGGESGPGARPFNITWARQTVRQCREASVPVFVKQLGAKPYADRGELWRIGPRGERRIIRDKKGGDPSEWPVDLRVREYPR